MEGVLSAVIKKYAFWKSFDLPSISNTSILHHVLKSISKQGRLFCFFSASVLHSMCPQPSSPSPSLPHL